MPKQNNPPSDENSVEIKPGVKVRRGKISEFSQMKRNPNKGTKRGQYMREESVKKFLTGGAMVAGADNVFMKGNHIAENLHEHLGDDAIIIETDGTTPIIHKRTNIKGESSVGYEFAVADNQSAYVGLSWDREIIEAFENSPDVNLDIFFFPDELDLMFDEMENEESTPGGAGAGLDKTAINESRKAHEGGLYKKFLLPPFSVWDARSGAWLERKRAWYELGVDSEKPRDSMEKLVSNHITAGTQDDIRARFLSAGYQGSLSDPVIAEISYKWFCPPGGIICDPFCGGSTWGIVASYLGYKYIGIDLSSAQIENNHRQLETYLAAGGELLGNPPVWLQGDSRLLNIVSAPVTHNWNERLDLFFSCPPYYNLERYSDDPADLSAMRSYEDFLIAYRGVIYEGIDKLKPNRFAVFVVGDVRDKRGYYYNFVNDTIAAFLGAGAMLYNRATLLRPVGSTAIRVGKQFSKNRKLGTHHQDILIFYKGDIDAIRREFPPLIEEQLLVDGRIED